VLILLLKVLDGAKKGNLQDLTELANFWQLVKFFRISPVQT
jgi:hypothetical protein